MKRRQSNKRHEQTVRRVTRRTRSCTAKHRICITCNQQFDSEDSLQSHLAIFHNSHFCEKCDVCGKEFREKIFFEVHRLTHTDQKPYRCTVCEEVFVQKRRYMRHWEVHMHSKYAETYTKKKEAYICDVCRKEFDSSESLEWHIKTHDPFKCDVCLRIFDDRPTYMKHRNHHRLQQGSKALPENCTVCQKTFSCGIELLQHIASHQLQECDICGKFFEDASGLKRHRTSHEKKTTHDCDICGKVLEERIFYEIHRLSHFEQKPFPCDICNDIFPDKTAFLRHRNNHKLKKEMTLDRFHNMKEALKMKLRKG